MITFKDLAQQPLYLILDRIKSGEEVERPFYIPDELKESMKKYRELYSWQNMYICDHRFPGIFWYKK